MRHKRLKRLPLPLLLRRPPRRPQQEESRHSLRRRLLRQARRDRRRNHFNRQVTVDESAIESIIMSVFSEPDAPRASLPEEARARSR